MYRVDLAGLVHNSHTHTLVLAGIVLESVLELTDSSSEFWADSHQQVIQVTKLYQRPIDQKVTGEV